MAVQKYRSIERIVDNIGDKRENTRTQIDILTPTHAHNRQKQSKVVTAKNLKAPQEATVIVIIVTNVSYKHL